jgi:hypothetical protein
MAATGYTRQSSSAIQTGQPVSAPPLTAEFDALQAAFDTGSGHDHTGSVPGDGQKISLTTAVVGILPLANGGVGVNASTTDITLTHGIIVNGGVLFNAGMTVAAGVSTFTGSANFPGTITGATTFTSSVNAVGGLLDNSNRAISKSNLFGTIHTTPSNPTGTTSAPGVMCGLNQVRCLVIINGNLFTNAGASVQLSYGTGTAPANGAALTGTAVGTALGTSAGPSVPVTLSAIISGLTLGTPYWIDIIQVSSTGALINIQNVTVTITEI